MSPRAACRLETLGFDRIYDFVPGKADWVAHDLPTEGHGPPDARIGGLIRNDVATCGLDDRMGDMRVKVEQSPYGFGLVVSDGILLGRLRKNVLEGDPARTAEQVMEPGPSTVRPDAAIPKIREQMQRNDLKTVVASTPEGKLLGAVRRGAIPEE